MWCGREKSYNFLVELVVVFLSQLQFDACRKESMVTMERNVGSRFSINNYILPFFLDKYGVKLCKSVRGPGGSKAFRPYFFICTFSEIAFWKKKILNTIKLLEMQNSISICRFSFCSSGSS